MRVLEVHRPALAVGQPAVVQDLQQDVEHVRVGLLDLVEQDHASRACAAPPRSAGRPLRSPRNPGAPRSAGDTCASPCTRTCRGGSCSRSSSNRASARARASSVLPTPVGPRKMKLPIGRLGILDTAAGAQHRVSHRRAPPRPGRSPAGAGSRPDAAASPARPPSDG